MWGWKDYVSIKHTVWQALREDKHPDDAPHARDRLSRIGIRNALRQWRREEGSSELVRAWSRRFDRGRLDIDTENPGH